MVSDIRGITYETFKERCIFLPFRCFVYPTRNLSSLRGEGSVTYAENRIVDRLRSIYFQYSFSVNGSRRHNVFAEYKTFGKSTVISRKPDSMLSPPLSLRLPSTRTRVLLRFENYQIARQTNRTVTDTKPVSSIIIEHDSQNLIQSTRFEYGRRIDRLFVNEITCTGKT